MNAPAETQRENGGLFALTLKECDLLLEWFDVALKYGQLDANDLDEALTSRLMEWRRRHEDVG